MDDRQARGVQMQAAEVGRAVGWSVEWITDDRMTDAHEMHAQLVGTAGDRLERQAGDRFAAPDLSFDHAVAGHRAQAVLMVHTLVRVAIGVGGQGQVDLAGLIA